MIAIVAALLAALAADPLPDGKSIDSLSFQFYTGTPFLGPGGALNISADGKVSYFHQTQPWTGSGGIVKQKKWELKKGEAAALFGKLVADGLLELPEPRGANAANRFHVTSGRWQLALAADPVPDKLMAHLRPLLAEAHPGLWTEKPPVKLVPMEKPRLTSVRYSFTAKAEGEEATLTVGRNGGVTYRRQTHPNAPGGQKVLVNEAWAIPAKDAEALLDALVSDGLFELENTLGARFPNHSVQAQAGRWKTTFYPKELPEKVSTHLLPLLRKADGELWK
jgi:hypothetical protein